MTNLTARDRLIVALDAATTEEAERCVARLGDAVSFYKIGMELIYGGGGLALAERLIDAGRQVFIDLKLHDIPHTVERGVAQIARLGATFLTVHAYPQTMRAAVAGAAGSRLKLLGVSALTSADDADLAEAGYALGARALVSRRAAQAEAIGLAGLVLSAAEVAMLRSEGRKLTLVCPASARPAASSPTRSGSRPHRARSGMAPIILSSAARSPPPPIRAPRPRRSSGRSPSVARALTGRAGDRRSLRWRDGDPGRSLHLSTPRSPQSPPAAAAGPGEKRAINACAAPG